MNVHEDSFADFFLPFMLIAVGVMMLVGIGIVASQSGQGMPSNHDSCVSQGGRWSDDYQMCYDWHKDDKK